MQDMEKEMIARMQSTLEELYEARRNLDMVIKTLERLEGKRIKDGSDDHLRHPFVTRLIENATGIMDRTFVLTMLFRAVGFKLET